MFIRSLLLIPVMLLGCQRPIAAKLAAEVGQTGPATLTIGPEILRTQVTRLGINLSGQTFYDSGQMLRNLTFRNPGFEGETWQSILRCKAATATTCTDENPYAQWKNGFLDGASVQIISGSARGANGIVRNSTAADGQHGETLQFGSEFRGLAAGDFVLVRIDKPGGAEAGWWTDFKGGASLDTEFKDLSPITPGKQALRIQAAGAGQTAAVSSYFDSYNGRSFLQLHGRYTVSFRAKALTRVPTAQVEVKRLDTAHGLHTFLSKTVALSSHWQDYQFDFNAAEDGSALGTVGLTFTFAGTTALLDDVSLVEAAAPDNPTAYRNAVVAALRTLHPGVLRYMDNGTDFGSSLDNMLAVPFARQRSGASTQEVVHEDIPMGLHEFLVLCAAVGAEPWYSMPPGTSPDDAAHLAEYLGGDAHSPYGTRRALLGQVQPWTTVFSKIHLELGNEQWNSRSFAGSTINDPTAYGQRASQVYAAMRAAPSFQPDRYDLILGSWATVPWWTEQELRSTNSVDSVAVAPYIFSEFNDAASTEAIFGPMFAEPEMIDSRPEGYMTQQLAKARGAGHPVKLAVYETNLGTMSGSATQADLDRTVPSLGAGLAVADHMLLMLRDLGVTTQCLFALPEYINGFAATTGAKEDVPLWGAVVDMGGPTNGRRPQYLALQLANQALLPTMLTTHLTGTPQIWDQTLSRNGKVELRGAHLIQSFAFADGDRRSLILLNLSRDHSIPLRLNGQSAPSGAVEESLLTAPAITANNETTAQVSLHKRHIPHFDSAMPYSLPPFSMTLLTWRAASR